MNINFQDECERLEQHLHDAEVALAAWMEWKKVQEADRIALTDALTAAQARIAALEEALEACLVPVHRTAHGHSAFANWQRCDWEPCLNARALLSPAPADAAHEPEAS